LEFSKEKPIKDRMAQSLTFTFIIGALLACFSFSNGFRYDNWNQGEHLLPGGERSSQSAGEALYISKYLNNPKLAQQLSRVSPLAEDPQDMFSYSGFVTVDVAKDSHMFYWFFPAQNGDVDAPVTIWLQGGPGGSSLFGLFVENGPYSLTSNLTVYPKPYTWNSKYAMLFIDNPVGTGFSYTHDQSGYSNNEDDVANNLYNCLQQFFTVYNNYIDNDLYITGESYAGKYIPALGYKILQENKKGKNPNINLKGLAIGDGFCDPITQVTAYADFAYNTGLSDESETTVIRAYQDGMVKAIEKKNWSMATQLFNELVNAQYYPGYYTNITGSWNYYDIRTTGFPDWPNFMAYVNSTVIRQKLHVGNHYFQDGGDVYNHLADDMMKSVKSRIPDLLDNYKVMFYNGQYDFIVGAPTTEAFLRSLDWKDIDGYKKVAKVIWKVDPKDVEVAGYVRQFKTLTQVIVRSAGHILPYDQPRSAFDMIDRFIQSKPFSS